MHEATRVRTFLPPAGASAVSRQPILHDCAARPNHRRTAPTSSQSIESIDCGKAPMTSRAPSTPIGRDKIAPSIGMNDQHRDGATVRAHCNPPGRVAATRTHSPAG